MRRFLIFGCGTRYRRPRRDAAAIRLLLLIVDITSSSIGWQFGTTGFCFTSQFHFTPLSSNPSRSPPHLIYNRGCGEKEVKKTLWLIITASAAVLITILWFRETPGDYFEKGFAVGASVCHQIPSHSFLNDGIQFPICARCTGLYLSSFFGLIYFFAQGKKKGLPGRGYLVLLALLAVVWAGDGVNSFISDFLNQPFLYRTTNLTRLATGIGMGLVMSTAIVTLFNVTVWKDGSREAVLRNPWQIAIFLTASAGSAVLLLFSKLFVFQFLAGISILAVLGIITLLYSIFWVILSRRENQMMKFVDLIPFLLAGFATAIGQVMLLNLLRTAILG